MTLHFQYLKVGQRCLHHEGLKGNLNRKWWLWKCFQGYQELRFASFCIKKVKRTDRNVRREGSPVSASGVQANERDTSPINRQSY